MIRHRMWVAATRDGVRIEKREAWWVFGFCIYSRTVEVYE